MNRYDTVRQTFRRWLLGSQLRRNVGYTLGRQLLAAVAQLLLVVIIARALGPEGNGQYAMAVLLPSMLVNVLSIGVAPATVYFVSRGDLTASQALTGNLRLGVQVVAIGLVASLPILYFFGKALFPGVTSSLLLVSLAVFPISLLFSFSNSILQGLEDFRAFNATTLIPPYIALVGTALALIWLGMGTQAAVVAYLIGQAAGLVFAVALLRGKHSDGVSREAIPGQTRKVLGYGWKAHISNILAFVNYRADIFLVNLLLNPAATGIYVIAVQIAERLWMLSQAASTVLLPRLSAMHEDPVARLRLTKRGFWVVLLLTALVGGIAAIALHWLLVPIFGVAYIEAMGAFLWLLPGIIAGAGARVQANCIAAAGKPEWNMYVAIVVIIVNITLNLILIPVLGISGAAIATSVAYVGNAMVKAALVLKVGRVPDLPERVASRDDRNGVIL